MSYALKTTRRPIGQPTRGKTAKNRLRRVDNFLLLFDPWLVRRTDGRYSNACFVDVGYGAEPSTTLESARRLRRANPALPVVGVEIDPERVAAARIFADALTDFRLGGFNLPLRDGETARLIRAFNVLRQYDEAAVAEAHRLLGSYLLPGGLLIEGTAEPFGRLWAANLLRKPGDDGAAARAAPVHEVVPPPLTAEGLLFSTNFRLGFDPADFQAILPKNYIHRVAPGEPIYDFFQAWKRASQETIAVSTWGMRQWFAATAGRLAAMGYDVGLRRRLLRMGYLLVRGL